LPGKLFDEIGFNSIKGKLLLHLVLTRLCYHVSKLKTTDYLFTYEGLTTKLILKFVQFITGLKADLEHIFISHSVLTKFIKSWKGN
jgi:hypothetical protein